MQAKLNHIIDYFKLAPHPEGGFYKETYRSDLMISKNNLPSGFTDERNFCTAIYFLLEKNSFSALHKIKSDELWHFYYGDSLEVIEISEQGELKRTLIGNQMEKDEVFQYLVKANTWFGSRVAKGGEYSLVGCTVSPGFDFADFEMADREKLIQLYPAHRKIISEMTR